MTLLKTGRENIITRINVRAAGTVEDGEKIFTIISKFLEIPNPRKIILNFKNVSLVTSFFLNTAIGQLYSKYDSAFLQEHLSVENMASEDLALLQKVIDNAKEYFKK
jgi:hypothetical protein